MGGGSHCHPAVNFLQKVNNVQKNLNLSHLPHSHCGLQCPFLLRLTTFTQRCMALFLEPKSSAIFCQFFRNLCETTNDEIPWNCRVPVNSSIYTNLVGNLRHNPLICIQILPEWQFWIHSGPRMHC